MSVQPNHSSRKRWSWRSQAFRALVYQVLAVAVIALLVMFLAHNTASNMRQRGMQSGFGFLMGTAGFDIGESLFTFDPGESYLQAYLVGVTNTLRVAVLGIVLTTLLGTLIGVGRFSRNALVRGLCRVYVEAFRNIPVLLQLLMWYLIFTEFLPAMAEAWEVGPFFLSKGGLNFPIPVWASGHLWAAWGLLLGVGAAVMWRKHAWRTFAATGVPRSMFWMPLGIFLVCGLAGWLLGGAPTEMNMPFRGDFAIENGGSLTPEFLALLIGLTMYTAAFVAEVVRGGIQAVPQGQADQ